MLAWILVAAALRESFQDLTNSYSVHAPVTTVTQKVQGGIEKGQDSS